MKNIIEIPLEEYMALKAELAVLKDSELIRKISRLIDLLYEEKNKLYLGDSTSDLPVASIQKNWDN